MRPSVVCLAILLALAVFHCQAKENSTGKKEQSKETGKENVLNVLFRCTESCNFQNNHIPHNHTRSLHDPCTKILCLGGTITFINCTPNAFDLEDNRSGQPGRSFPYCCEKKDETLDPHSGASNREDPSRKLQEFP
uniref:Putative secreted protein n=1 Tax=Amblyomma americanum TaxID=6943 RepID=A0A0C9S4E6_AMBAM